MQEKVEPLYPFILPTTEARFALLQLSQCVATLYDLPIGTIQETLQWMALPRGDENVAGTRSVRILARELNDLVFRLEQSESEAA